MNKTQNSSVSWKKRERERGGEGRVKKRFFKYSRVLDRIFRVEYLRWSQINFHKGERGGRVHSERSFVEKMSVKKMGLKQRKPLIDFPTFLRSSFL